MNMTVVDTYYDNRQVQSAGEPVGLVVFFQSSKPGATHAGPEVETATAPPAMGASTLNL